MALHDMVLLDFGDICRGCMAQKNQMRALFGSSLDTMLMTVTNVVARRDDGFPSQMCVQCVLQLSRAFTFKQQCERTDTILREHLARTYFTTDRGSLPLQEEMEVQHMKKENAVSEGISLEDIDKECVLILPREHETMPSSSQVVFSNIDVGSDFIVTEELTDDGMAQSYLQSDAPEHVPSTLSSNELNLPEDVKILPSYGMLEDDSIDLNGQITEAELYEADQYYQPEPSNEGNKTSGSYVEIVVSNEIFSSDIDLKPQDVSCGLAPESLITDKLQDDTQLFDTAIPSATPFEKSSNVYECNICRKQFDGRHKLSRHSKTHLVNKPHVCKTCGTTFADSSNLSKHIRRHTGELRNIVGMPHLCSVCGKRFKWATSLSKHMKLHTKRKLFFCTICPKFYVEKRSLDTHIRSHRNEKPFTCSLCDKNFSQKCNLKKHMRIHTGERPYQCSICQKRFNQSGYLVIHQRIHAQVKPYRCDKCGKTFVSSNARIIHERTHTGEKPYACDVCEKRFSRQETLNVHKCKHLSDKGGERTYHMCAVCGNVFGTQQSLKTHQKTHLGTSDETMLIQFVVDGSSLPQTDNLLDKD